MIPPAVAITSFEEFALWVYVLVDEGWPTLALPPRPGPAPRCSDQELVAMALIGECKGWHQETVLIREWAQHRDLFPHQPERSRFNRRRRMLQGVINAVRRALLATLDLATEALTVIDSLPIPVLRFASSRRRRRAEWAAYGARFGRVASKAEVVFGYKLYLLTTARGVIREFVLAPANRAEVHVGAAWLADQRDLVVLGDKGFISQAVRTTLRETVNVDLRTLPRRTERRQVTTAGRQAFGAVRRVIETVIGQLTEQFGIERNHAHSFWGLTARLITKLTAHTMCQVINRRLGETEVLPIKHLAFPPPN